MFIVFIIFTVFAGILFAEGYLTNPYLPNPFRRIPPLRAEYGEGRFDLPKVIPTSLTNTVFLSCNVSSYDFAVGSPAAIYVEAIIPTDWSYEIAFVEAMPYATREYFPPSWNISNAHSSNIHLTMTSNETFTQTWKGSTTAVFQAIGPISLGVRILIFPDTNLWEQVNWSTFNPEFVTTLEFQSITINSEQTTQQQTIENLNLSLAYFVLFFASSNIAVALYDHSEDKDKNAQYSEEKAKKKHGDITKYGKYIE